MTEDRCRACVMLDGGEDPCVPEHFLATIRERDDRPCPRVELEPANVVAANLFSLAISDHAGLVPLWFETIAEGMDGEERRAVIGRVVRALLKDEIVVCLRTPLPCVSKEGCGRTPDPSSHS